MILPEHIRNEADFQARVSALATRRYQLLHYHTHNSQRSEAGFPDSVFVGRKVLFRELKMTRKSRVSDKQKAWIERLDAAGADACFWYAEDYHSGLIDEQLRDAALRETLAVRRMSSPPMAMRLAKRLYLKTSDNPARAALLWEAGVSSVEHGRWIARAQEVLAIVAAELPAGDDEMRDWLAAHTLAASAGIAHVFTALKSDLTAAADASALLAGPPEKPVRRNGQPA